jgi:large subunit ribosomal protein L31
MKEGIHPQYRPVVFQDPSAGYAFLTRSTVKTQRTIKWEDGQEYPLITLEISSASHPFYTGRQKLMDTAGRVERFTKRFAKTEGKMAERKVQGTKAVAKVSDAVKKAMKNAPTVVAPLKRDDRDGGRGRGGARKPSGPGASKPGAPGAAKPGAKPAGK